MANQLCVALLLPSCSPLCWHMRGGAKKLLCAIAYFVQPEDYVFKTDVYSYYASIQHHLLMEKILRIRASQSIYNLILAYITRTIILPTTTYVPRNGIPKGGSLSPLLGAIYLTSLDRAMEIFMKRGDVFYARYMDDIILIARKRHIFRQAKQQIHQILEEHILGLRFEKTFLGRAHKGFDFLGYRIKPASIENFESSFGSKINQSDGIKILIENRLLVQHPTQGNTLSKKENTRHTVNIAVNQHSINKMILKGRQCYAQGGRYALAVYLKRWFQWANSGLHLFAPPFG